MEFLSFPADIRNAIYKTLFADCVVDVRDAGKRARRTGYETHNHPTPDCFGFLLSCLQIYREAILLYYVGAMFRLDYHHSGAFLWFTQLVQHNPIFIAEISKILGHHVTEIGIKDDKLKEKTDTEYAMRRTFQGCLSDLHLERLDESVVAQWEYVEPTEE